jgi:5-methylcytosine-specific restriction enzyme subunit McrC
MHLVSKLIKTKTLEQLQKTEQGKPILELNEYEKFNFIGDNLTLIKDEEKICEQLEEDYKIQISKINNGIRISADWYVGAREFENFILYVGPKFVQLENLGRLIDFAYDVKTNEFDDEIRFNSGVDQPLEFIIHSFIQTTSKIIKKGLHRSYEIYNDNVSFLRGKLLLKNQIQNDLKFNMKFNCEFDEFTSNNLENQIILYTLKMCKILTKFPQRKIHIQKLIHQIDSQIEEKQITLNDFRKIQYSKLNSRYRKPHDLAKLIIKNIGIHNLKYQKTRFIVPFFVKMPDLFEKFLENLLLNYHQKGLTVKAQKRFQAWYKDGTAASDGGIKPDILIYKDNEIVSILDAKYMKDIKESQKYQIAFYLNYLKRSVGHTILPFEEINDYELSVPKQDITIKVKHVDIDNILNTLYSKNQSKEEIKNEIQDLVEKLIE